MNSIVQYLPISMQDINDKYKFTTKTKLHTHLLKLIKILSIIWHISILTSIFVISLPSHYTPQTSRLRK